MTQGRRAVAAAILGLACSEGQPDGPAGARPVVSVTDFGTRGDGQTLDTAAIQAAVDATPRGGTLRFPPGTYRIQSEEGVRLKDEVRLELGDAVLVGTNVDGARCRLLEIQGRKGVVISGGTLIGSRLGSPEWGVGILASDAEDLVIENVTLRDFYFDGILLTGNRGCRRVLVRGVVAENNRRTGLAVPSASDVTVEASSFRGSRGQSPEAGVNCEPNPGGEVRDVRFRGCTFTGNSGVGLYVHRGRGVAVADASVEDSVVADNGHGIVMVGVEGVSIVNNRVTGHRGRAKSGIVVGETSKAIVAGNHLEANFRGILSGGATGVDIRGNTVVGTGPAAGPGAGEDANGIVCLGPSSSSGGACVVAENTVRRCAGSGVVVQLVSRVHLQDNTIEEVGQRGLFLRSASRSEVRGNSVARNGLETPGQYDAIELALSSNDNVIATNLIRLGVGTRNAIGIGPGCRGNQVTGNVVLPY